MNAAKHTPGPWHVEPVGEFFDFRKPNDDGAKDMMILAENGICTGIVWEYGEEGEANATLKAAAPELAQSADAFLRWFRTVLGDAAYNEITCDELNNLRAALAKAGL